MEGDRVNNSTRIITTHHDGHGLNDAMVIIADERDAKAGNSSHHYYVVGPERFGSPLQVQFQHGPRHVGGSTAGVTEAVLYAVLIDRLEGFQSGPFAHEENEIQLAALRTALASTKRRADERAARGVLGKAEK